MMKIPQALRNATQAAFTLVELLVVVAIIALLISILLPSLANAREQAKKVRCIANLKDLASSMNGYANQDRTENVIPVHWRGMNYQNAPDIPFGKTFVGPNEWGGRGGNPDGIWSPPAIHKKQFTQYWNLGPADRPLNGFMYARKLTNSRAADEWQRYREDAKVDMPVFQCPSDVGWQPDRTSHDEVGLGYHIFGWDTGRSNYDVMGNSYRAHLIWSNEVNRHRKESFTGGIVYSVAPYLRPASQFPPNAVRVVLVTEGNAYLTDTWNRADYNDPLTFSSIPGTDGAGFWSTGWHGGFQTYTAAFADGHAGVIVQDMLTDINLSMLRPPVSSSMEGDFPKTSNQRVGSRPEWIDVPWGTQHQWANAMSRGDGWQMDCLPAPPVLAMQQGQ